MAKWIAILFMTLAIVGGALYWRFANKDLKIEDDNKGEKQKVVVNEDPIMEELNSLASEIVKNMKIEVQMNLDMVAQLRAHYSMLEQLQEYSRQIENDINMIKEISRDEFQENVILQAMLFKGKKPALIAKHLREFNPVRVGAILSKLKKKDASKVLDKWTSFEDQKFYKDVMAAYLRSRRRDARPELFKSFSE